MTDLRKRMVEAMLLRGMAERTRESYVDQVARLARHYKRSPEGISDEEVQSYLLYMITERKLSWSTCSQAVHAFRFLYHTTLGRERTQFEIPGPRVPQKLPEILSREEVGRILEEANGLRQRAVLETIYSAGLRVSELVHMKVADIDSERMTIRVQQGKGGRDRYLPLSALLLERLRAYWRERRPRVWLFAPRSGDKPMDPTVAQRMYYAAKDRARIRKQGGIHALRHAFATHLLEAGVDLHTIQRLLGHGHISSTMRYLHLVHATLMAKAAPLDLLDLPVSKGR